MIHLRKVVLCLAFTFYLSSGLRADPGELIVLLAAGPEPPRPEDVVAQVRQGKPLPGGLGAGNPTGGRLLIPEQERRRPVNADPESAGQLLLRYVVLSYPVVVDLDAVQTALMRNPHVLSVGPNREMDVSVAPNDPLFPALDSLGNPRTPDQYQWGSYSLRLPEAWDYNYGHAYVGVIDLGLDTTHPDLRAFHPEGTTWVYDGGGNFRPQLSFDYAYPSESPNSVDEGQPEIEGGLLRTPELAGHGTHVSGIIAGTANSSTGIAGACWNCSLTVSKVSHLKKDSVSGKWANSSTPQADVVAGINGAIQKGAQVLNLSLGYRPFANPPAPDCQANPLDSFCVALQYAQTQDVVIAAAVGNDFTPTVDFPASDSRTIAVGGITSTGSFWNDCVAPGSQCGSNYSPEQIVSPAKQILSTFYRGLYYAGAGSTCPGLTDFGLCTGTSMASP